MYRRENIRQETAEDPMTGESVTGWVYDQTEYTREEWEQLNSPATKTIMQAISGLELDVAMLSV